MKALCWQGVGRPAVESVPDPELLNRQDILVRVRASSVCGSDLHLLNGFVPAMAPGDVIGHEFLGEVLEIGPEVRRHRAGDRVVVASPLGCGACVYCAEGRWSLCDNSNPMPELAELAFGHAGALHQAVRACAKGGTVSVAGVFGGFVDKFPMGAIMNKALTLRSGQQHGQKYIPDLIERVVHGDLELAPATATRLLGVVARLLPATSQAPGHNVSGVSLAEQQGSVLAGATMLSERAARRNNEPMA